MMNITPMTIYWLTRLDSIKEFIGNCPCSIIIAIASLIAAIALFLFANFSDNDAYGMFDGKSNEELNEIHKRFIKWAKTMLKVFVFCSSFTAIRFAADSMIPTTKEMAAIVIIPKIANSESLANIGNGIVELATSWVEELKPNKKESEVK